MPITQSAKKALRGSARKHKFNDARRKKMRSTIKDTKRFVGTSAKNKEELSAAFQAIDKAAKRGVIKKNTASRRKSRLVKLFRRGAGQTDTKVKELAA